MGMAVSIERARLLDWRMMVAFDRAVKLARGRQEHWYKRAVTPLIGGT
jgi:hypothetical protein